MNAEYLVSPDDRILVTGSNGFVGGKVVETLLEYGFLNLRCFVRPSSRLDRLKEVLDRFPAGESVELISGDLLSRIDCRKAAKGVSKFMPGRIAWLTGFDRLKLEGHRKILRKRKEDKS